MTTNLPISTTNEIKTEEEKQIISLFQKGKSLVQEMYLVESPSQLIVGSEEEYLLLKSFRAEKALEKEKSRAKMMSKYKNLFGLKN